MAVAVHPDVVVLVVVVFLCSVIPGCVGPDAEPPCCLPLEELALVHTHTHTLSLSLCVCASLCVSCGTTARPSARQPLICTCPTRFEVRFGCLVGGPGVWAFTLHLWMPPFSFNGVSSTHMDARYGHHRIPACCFKRPSVRIRGV